MRASATNAREPDLTSAVRATGCAKTFSFGRHLGTFWVMLRAKLLPVPWHGLPTETVVRSVPGKKSHNLQIAPQPGLD